MVLEVVEADEGWYSGLHVRLLPVGRMSQLLYRTAGSWSAEQPGIIPI
jgi:hypothetical protein